MATTTITSEQRSGPPTTAAPQQSDLETRLELNSAAEPEPRDNQDEGDHRDSQDEGDHRDNQDEGDHKDNQDEGDHKDNQDEGDHRDNKDNQDEGDHRDDQGEGDNRDNQDEGDHKDNQDEGDHKDIQDEGDHKDKQDEGYHKDNQDEGDHRDDEDEGDHKDNKDEGDHKDNQDKGDHRDNQDKGDHRDNQDEGDHKDNKDEGDHRDNQDKGDHRDNQDEGDHKDNQDEGDHRDDEDEGDHKDNKDEGDHRDNQDEGDHKDNQDKGDHRDNQDEGDHKDNQDEGDHRDSQDGGDHRDDQDEEDHRDNEEEEDARRRDTLSQENESEQSLDQEEDWVEEGFRIDRKKLAHMLCAPKHEYGETGEEFFERVMRETNTQVKWPSKLKMGAKSKKNPQVKVKGRKDNVVEAKKKILEVLDVRENKVTLKMDVAYTEHSHVIGKGGGNMKKVMEVTSCHVHFPDCNRHSATRQKSNQVSIAGPIEGVEEARKRIRELQPLSLTFELPVSLLPQAVLDEGSPLIQQIVQTLGVGVSFRTVSPQSQAQPAFYGSYCTVRGLQGNVAAIKKATCVLMELLLGPEATGGVVTSQLDVTSQQHQFLLGQNDAHFLGAMYRTQIQVILPDLSGSQSLPSLLIQGSPDGVCLARQQLMDCLPVCLMFDMYEDGEADSFKVAQMMQNLGVFISVKPKVKQTSKSVVVKGLERNISCLYEAHRLLLGLDSCKPSKVTELTSDLVPPESGLTSYWLNMLLQQQLRLSDQGPVPVPATLMPTSSTKPKPSPPPGFTSPTEEGRTGSKGTDSRPLEKILENEDQSGQFDKESAEVVLMTPLEVYEAVNHSIGRRGSLQSPEISKVLSQGRRHSTGQVLTYSHDRLLNRESEWGRSERRNSLRKDMTLPSNACGDSSEAEDFDYEKKKLLATRAMQRKPVFTEVQTPTDTWSGLGFSKSMPAEAIKELRNISRRNYKPYLSSNSNQQSWTAQRGKMGNGSDSLNWRERRGSTSSMLPISSSSSSSSSSPSSPPATFSSSVSGFPVFASSVSRSRNDNPSESFVSTNSFFEGLCSSRRASNCSQRSSSPNVTDELAELLNQLGLINYIDVFEQQEIDYPTFLTLSDEDLKGVGISTFGARRKMLLAIAELSKRRLSDTSAVKPGYLEGGASGRLPRILGVEVAAQSNRW